MLYIKCSLQELFDCVFTRICQDMTNSFGRVAAEQYFLLYTIPIPMALLLIIYVESRSKSSHQKYKLTSFMKMNFQMVGKKKP